MFLPLVPPRNQNRSNTTSLDSMELMGTVLSGITYGVAFTICTLVLCANYAPKFSWRTLVTCWLLLLATISTALQIRWSQRAFVTQRQESPSEFIEEHVNNWIYVMLNVLYVVINWSADGILVFRFFSVFNRSLRWCILPAPLYFTSLVTGSLALRELAIPGTIQDANRLANWLIIYRTVSLSLCVILTSFITGRLVMVHRRGDSGLKSKSPFGNIIRMLVESASLETASTLVYLITVGLGSPLQNVFLPILGQVQVIAPMLIMYRVVRGRDTMAGPPKHRNKTVSHPSLCIQIGHATSFSNMTSGEYSAVSPTGSGRGFDLPCYSYPPPYATSPLKESSIGNIPQSPSVDPAHLSGFQKLGTRLPSWP